MSKNVEDLKSRLPRIIGLGSHTPARRGFTLNGFDPKRVKCAADLPPYLILGELDETGCQFLTTGWRASWQGGEKDTHFDVTYKGDEDRYEITQTWCGVHGGLTTYRAVHPLAQIIGLALYQQFPEGWDGKAKESLEGCYQLSYVRSRPGWPSVCHIPDGAFRVISFPVAAHDLKPVFECLSEAASMSLPFPFHAYARLIVQRVSYFEGHAPDWETTPLRLVESAIEDTGFPPLSMPQRTKEADGSAASTLEREVYVVFIAVPFAGLTDMLYGLRDPGGHMRYRDDPTRRFDLRPAVFPMGFAENMGVVAFWDGKRATRCAWVFRREEDGDISGQVQAAQQGPEVASSQIATVESISSQL